MGKTTLLNRVITGNFDSQTAMTIGVDFHVLNLTVDNKAITLQLWDLGGQERFRFMVDGYITGAKGALLLFDLTRARTLSEIEDWIGICRKNIPDLPIMLVGTKLDLGDQIVVTDEDARQFLEPFNLFDYLKVSSKDGTNVMEAFEQLTRKIIEVNKLA